MCVLWWTSSAEDLAKARPHSTQANGRSPFAVHARVLHKVEALAEGAAARLCAPAGAWRGTNSSGSSCCSGCTYIGFLAPVDAPVLNKRVLAEGAAALPACEVSGPVCQLSGAERGLCSEQRPSHIPGTCGASVCWGSADSSTCMRFCQRPHKPGHPPQGDLAGD